MCENANLIKAWGNDKKRKEFLAAYQDWRVWLTTPELDLAYYRYTMPDGKIIIAMEHKRHAYQGYDAQPQYKWENDVSYFLQKPDEPFTPNSKISTSAVADLLKDAKVSLQNKAN
jgi:hypothetical protein